MPSRDDIVQFLDKTMQADRFTDGLPIGLQVQGRPEVRRVATAVSACVEVFEAAAEWGADMVLVHHGMFWEKETRVLAGPLRRRVKLLLDHDITLVSYHLPLDAHAEIGNNALFIRGVGFEDPEPFGEYHGQVIGWRGRFESPLAIREFIARGSRFYGCEPRAAFLEGADEIRSAAVISGGAWEFVDAAARAGVDAFVTGAADEPAFHLAREWGVNFFAWGHHATERAGVRRLGEVLGEQFEIDVRFFDVDNPL